MNRISQSELFKALSRAAPIRTLRVMAATERASELAKLANTPSASLGCGQRLPLSLRLMRLMAAFMRSLSRTGLKFSRSVTLASNPDA